jgi:hypothetical protein
MTMALPMNDRTRLYVETLQRVTWRYYKPVDQDVGYFYSRLNGMFSACYFRQSMVMCGWRELMCKTSRFEIFAAFAEIGDAIA